MIRAITRLRALLGIRAIPAESGPVTVAPDTDSNGPITLQAVAELEAGRLRKAQELAAAADAAGEASAAPFLEALADIRRNVGEVQRRPRVAQPHFALACSYFLADAGQLAMAEATKALRLNPRLGEAYALRSAEYCFRGERLAAEREYTAAASLLPPHSEWLTMASELRQRTFGLGEAA